MFSRAWCVSALEAATALLLETEYNWALYRIGIAIAICFLGIVPLRLCYEARKNDWSVATWMHVFLAISYAASLMIFRTPPWLLQVFNASVHRGKAVADYILLVADTFLFASFYMTDGLSQGIMYQHMLPASVSMFNVNSVSISVSLLTGIARGLGPVLARIIVANGGQNAYAFVQFMCVFVGSVVGIFGVLRNLL